MKVLKKVFTLTLCALLVLALSSCSAKIQQKGEINQPEKEITIAHQFGTITYAALIVAKEQGLIEKTYKEATGNTVKVNWQILGSGAEINEAIEAGKVQIGVMGSVAAITGIEAGLPYKIFTSVSSQSLTLQTNDENIKTLKDIVDSKKKIATVGITAHQRIVLAMACEEELNEPLIIPDDQIIGVSHPNGKVGLESGTYKLHLTNPPFNWQETDDGYTQVSDETFKKVWPAGSTFVVGVASNDLYKNDSILYEAVRTAIDNATNYVNNNQDEVATKLSEIEGVTKETYLNWLQREDCIYSTTCVGVENIAQFMYRNGFAKQNNKFSDLTFANVKGN